MTPETREMWRDRLSRQSLQRLALGLFVGLIGGLIAEAIHMPLAWMLGPLFICMAASVAGLPVLVPIWFRYIFLALVGLFLGESFGKVSLDDLAQWPFTLAGAVIYVPIGGYLCYLLFRYAARMPKGDAILCGLPGGLTAVALFAGEIGGDERRVSLSQSTRVAVVILSAPAIAVWVLGLPAQDAKPAPPETVISAVDFLILAAAAALSVVIGERIRMPMPQFIGPIFASAVVRMTGLVEGGLPVILVELALLVSGASIGTRFHGAKLGFFISVASWATLGSILLMALSAVFAAVFSVITGVDFFAALLAYAPGGIAEMSLIALAIDADPAFVATHHLARILAIIVALPLMIGWLKRVLAED